jgi:small GTP-binding protein
MALRKIPSTVGLNSIRDLVARVRQNQLDVVLWDLGGKAAIRNIWTHYYSDAEFLVFMIDGADRSRFLEAKQVFRELLNEEKLRSIPILFLVNKHDLENCASVGYIKEYFEIEEVKNHQVLLFHISSLTQYHLNRENLEQIISSKTLSLA